MVGQGVLVGIWGSEVVLVGFFEVIFRSFGVLGREKGGPMGPWGQLKGPRLSYKKGLSNSLYYHYKITVG